MLKDEIISVGKFGKPIGKDGVIKIEIDPDFERLLKKLKFLFIYIAGNYVPFKIAGYQVGQVHSVKFSDINTPETVAWMTNKMFGIHRSEIPSKYRIISKSNIDITGYTVMDDKKIVGLITAIIKNPGQTLIEVSSSDQKVFLIPFVDALILDLNNTSKMITMNLPEGILDL